MASGWAPVPDGSPFPVTNLPFGVASGPRSAARVVVPVGEQALDLAVLAGAGLLDGTVADPAGTFGAATLDRFLAAGPAAWTGVRTRLQELLDAPAAPGGATGALVGLDQVHPQLPFTVADYVDFYSSLEHASTVGRIFRPGGEPVPPAWRHQPLGYHGRAGTVVVSGTPVRRPWGHWRPSGSSAPEFAPSAKLDVEVEVGFVVGVPSAAGQPVSTADFRGHVFGCVLVNDWSARDIQSFETVPLGPFLGKSFATTVSPWVVPLDALEAARVAPPVQHPAPSPHLRCAEDWGLALDLELEVNGTVLTRPPYASMYWTMPQQLAHATSNGAVLRTGDLFASGTVSGADRAQCGSLLELTWDGRDPFTLADGARRTYLEDGDTAVIRAAAPGTDGGRIGFGECRGTVQAAARVSG